MTKHTSTCTVDPRIETRTSALRNIDSYIENSRNVDSCIASSAIAGPCKFASALFLMVLFFAAAGCGERDEADRQTGLLDGEGVAIEGAWARPGSEGGMSAGYFLITNFDTEADTLVGASSEVAELTEIHESYEREEGMMGMRQIDRLELPPQSTLRFEPGGLHLMFIRLQENLTVGDEIEVRLQFSSGEEQSVTLTVQN